jgi:transposase
MKKEQAEEPGEVTAMLGIDTSKETLECTLVDAKTRQRLWSQTVPNTPIGIAELLKKAPPEAPWVIEPTGHYSREAVHRATKAGRQVLLAPPRKAKSFLRSLQSRAKTDRLDSYGLALFALSQSLAPYPIKTEQAEQMDQFLLARRGISLAISSLKQQRKVLTHAHEPLTEAIKALTEQQRALDKKIAALCSASSEFKAVAVLLKVPGIGPVTAAAVTSRLCGKQFARADQFVAYVGLDVGVAQSGKHKGELGLTRQGDALLRHLLYLCAQSSLRAKDTLFHQQYDRERAKGLSTTAAVCAVARKLARLCWSLVHYGTEFDPARVYQAPGRAALRLSDSPLPAGGTP